MQKSILIISFLILIPYVSVHGQEIDSLSSHSKTQSFIDIRGNNILLQTAFNFEYQLTETPNTAVLFNSGFGIFGSPFYVSYGLYSPLTITILTGESPYHKRIKHFELNAGYLYIYGINLYTPRASIGYRYQNPQTGKLFRVYAGYLSVGISFGL